VHHILVSGCLRQSTKHLKKPALCGLCCFCLSTVIAPHTSAVRIPRCVFGPLSNRGDTRT
jgi:hypothetical protein